LTVSEKALLVVTATLSETCTMKPKVPLALGVPPMTPVEALSARPAGNDPATTCQLL
jgi:hypothetical protein